MDFQWENIIKNKYEAYNRHVQENSTTVSYQGLEPHTSLTSTAILRGAAVFFNRP